MYQTGPEEFVIHYDMDSFFASVELLERPELRDEVVVVGKNRMIATSNYAARKYKIRSGIPMYIADEICRQFSRGLTSGIKLHKLPVNDDKYKHYSKLTEEVMARYDQKFEAVGLDEGYLDLTPLVRAELPPEPSDEQIEKKGQELMRKIQRDVFEATGGLTLSLGMAPNRFLSKLCSEVNKPNGTFIMRRRRETVLEFLDKVPLRRVKHIGPHNGRIIAGLGRARGRVTGGIGSLTQLRDSLWKFQVIGFSEKKRNLLLKLSIGYDETVEVYQNGRKEKQSLGRSQSFFPDAPLDSDRVRRVVNSLSDLVIQNLTERGFVPGRVCVEIIRSDLQHESKCK